jgi:MFS family permease
VQLTVIRLIQGIGVGGEWGGSVSLAMEWARTTKNRGFLAAWPQFGGPAGLFLANVAVLFFSWYSGDQFLVWGWRIPFFLSIVMVAIGLWIRLGITETPVFQKILDEDRVERVPVLEVLKRQPKQVILSALLRMPEQAPGYIVGTFIFTYATTVLGVARNFVFDRCPLPSRHRVCLGPDGWTVVRQHRPQKHVLYRQRIRWSVWVYLLCVAGHQGAEFDLYRDRVVAASSHDLLWSAGGADRGKLHSCATAVPR